MPQQYSALFGSPRQRPYEIHLNLAYAGKNIVAACIHTSCREDPVTGRLDSEAAGSRARQWSLQQIIQRDVSLRTVFVGSLCHPQRTYPIPFHVVPAELPGLTSSHFVE